MVQPVELPRYFHVDIDRHHGPMAMVWTKFGTRVLQYDDYLLVVAADASHSTAIGQWNQRCETTFSSDVVQVHDRFVSINSIRTGGGMLDELRSFVAGKCDAVLIVVHRTTEEHRELLSSTEMQPVMHQAPAGPAQSLADYLGDVIQDGNRPGDGFRISVSAFRNLRLFISKDCCQVIARQALEEDPTGEPRQLIYIALWFDSVRFRIGRTKWARTRWQHHVTLAYVPLTTTNVNYISATLNGVLRDWWLYRGTGHDRAQSLLTSRSYCALPQAAAAVSNFYDGEPTYDFLSARWSEIERLIEGDQLVFVHDPPTIQAYKIKHDTIIVPKNLLLQVCWKYYDRDCDRYQHGKALEDRCKPRHSHPEYAEIRLDECKVTEDCEMVTLLHYLKEALIFKFGIRRLQPASEVHLLNHWHITPQSNRIWTEKLRRDGCPQHIKDWALMYPDFVECLHLGAAEL